MVDIIEHLTADGDLSAEKAAGVIDRLEEELDQDIRCRECNELADPPHVLPLAYPRPWRDDERVICQSCWAEEVADRTALTETKAETLALKLAGLSNNEIGSALGKSSGTVASTLSRLKRKSEGIEEEIAELERTAAVLDTVVWRR